MELVRKLKALAEEGNPIRIGIVGCGQMGSGVVHSVENIVGMTIGAIADIDPQRGIDAFASVGRSREDVVVTDKTGVAEDALAAGKVVVTEDALLLTRIDSLDANVEATGVPDIGAKVAYHSIFAGIPFITLNAEMDVTVGAYLNHLARASGSIYTVASGDEPGVCKMMYEQAVLMGFEVVCLGKGKNNPLDPSATPDSLAEEAASKDMNPKMLVSFVDGTKTMVEMASVSNSTGMLPDVPGMRGPKVELDELASTFIPKSGGGIFERRGTVEYSTGKVSPGVFAIVYSDDPRIRKDMKFITKAEGPYYLQYRPYHLCDIETPQSIAEAVLLGEVTAAPERMNSEVVCMAKRDIKAGERVGGIGGADIYGRIYTYSQARSEGLIPLGIAAGGVAAADIKKGSPMTKDSFRPDDTTFVYRMRMMQDSCLAQAESGGIDDR